MVEPIVLEFKIDDIYIDNPLLSKNDLLKYDTEYCYEKVTKEITQEEQIRELYSEITSSLKFLSKLEFKYFLICLYYKESQAEFMRQTGATRTSFYQIKDSCVVKMAGAMGYTKEI